MIEGMQIMMHYPMLQIDSPANLNLIQQSIAWIVNFEIYDMGKLFDYPESDKIVDKYLALIGYDSFLLIETLGFHTYVLGLAASGTILLLLIKAGKSCCRKTETENEGGVEEKEELEEELQKKRKCFKVRIQISNPL